MREPIKAEKLLWGPGSWHLALKTKFWTITTLPPLSRLVSAFPHVDLLSPGAERPFQYGGDMATSSPSSATPKEKGFFLPASTGQSQISSLDPAGVTFPSLELIHHC